MLLQLLHLVGGYTFHKHQKKLFNFFNKFQITHTLTTKHNGLSIEDVDHLIPHQANDRISLMVARGLKIPVEKVIRNIDRFGNTTAASIPIAMDEALKGRIIKDGDIVVLTAFGSGYTWGSAVIQF